MASAEGLWSQLELAGHPCHIYEPPTPSVHGFVVLYLHGVHLGQLRDQPPFCRQFDRHGLRAIAPVAGRSWWSDRVCAEFDPELSAARFVLEHVVPQIESRWGAQPPRIGLLGTSMGGQGALRLALQHPDTFPVVAALAPAIDYQIRWQEGDESLRAMYPSAEAARQDTALLHIHPLNWPRHIYFACDPADARWHASAERLRMKLAALGVPHQVDLETEAGGHGFTYYNAMAEQAVGFIAERLERERNRIV